MGKHETLPFKMVIERGKLVPAHAYDAERLDTWRNGTRVNVTFVRDGGRVMERKWWAILGRAVKECKTPWKTSAEASEAIKLAIGVVNLTKTVGGDFLAYPKSLTDLSDPELDDAVQQMIDVVHGVTGVDPEEWKKQAAHIRDDEPSTDSSPADDSAVADEVPPSDSAAAGSSELDEGYTRADCVKAFLRTATDTDIVSGERCQVIDQMRTWWGDALRGDARFVENCHGKALLVAKGELGEDAARKYLGAL